MAEREGGISRPKFYFASAIWREGDWVAWRHQTIANEKKTSLKKTVSGQGFLPIKIET